MTAPLSPEQLAKIQADAGFIEINKELRARVERLESIVRALHELGMNAAIKAVSPAETLHRLTVIAFIAQEALNPNPELKEIFNPSTAPNLKK